MSGAFPDMGIGAALKDAQVVDLSALGGGRRYCGSTEADVIRKALADTPVEAVHWLGGSDSHFLSRFMLEKVDGPFALLLLDRHTGMREPDSEAISCRDWLRDAFTSLENLGQVLMIGIDLNLELEILDFVFDGVLAVTDEDLRHSGDSLSQDVTEMISLLDPGIPVYVSVDEAVACTAGGHMTSAQMKEILTRVARGHRILGIDFCGPETD